MLKKYLKAKKIASKEDMKSLQKKLAYKCYLKEKGNTVMNDDTPLKITKYVNSWFDKFKRYGGGGKGK